MNPASGRAPQTARRWVLAIGLATGVLAAAAFAWLGGRSAAPAMPTATATATATEGAAPKIVGRVVLAPALQGRVGPDDAVIIEARLLDGPRMPVARLKRRASELPLDFDLDGGTVTSPNLRLSPSMALVVSARVSRPGQEAPLPGDLQGTSKPLAVGTRDVVIEINDAVP